jgi:hypothetical protein
MREIRSLGNATHPITQLMGNARICGGGDRQWSFLLRLCLETERAAEAADPATAEQLFLGLHANSEEEEVGDVSER